jgi:DNA-binding XRE family transcriptional regulator
MEPAKRQRLEAVGWTVGDASDFLGLSPEEAAFIELKLALSRCLKQHRESQQLTQQALAKQIKSSQSRVAKMEAGNPSVSLDLRFAPYSRLVLLLKTSLKQFIIQLCSN